MVSAMMARHSSETSRTSSSPISPASCSGAVSAVPAGDERRRAGEGDPEQQHQDRHAADDLDVEARDLPQTSESDSAISAMPSPSARGQREADER